MKILIIGAGCVGTATGGGFRRLGNDVFFYDIDKERQAELLKQGHSLFEWGKTDPDEMDVVFICVEEWNIDAVFREWKPTFSDNTVEIVIRSTVPPGTCKRLSKEYNCNVIHNPEFLKEATALHDFMNPDKIIIGSDRGAVFCINTLYSPFVNVPKIWVGTVTSEFLKLASNAVLSSYISTWNQIKMIADALGVNSHEIAKILTLDPRISKYGTIHGKRFGGFCLPKDLEALIKTGVDLKVDTTLLNAILMVNKEMPE